MEMFGVGIVVGSTAIGTLVAGAGVAVTRGALTLVSVWFGGTKVGRGDPPHEVRMKRDVRRMKDCFIGSRRGEALPQSRALINRS